MIFNLITSAVCSMIQNILRPLAWAALLPIVLTLGSCRQDDVAQEQSTTSSVVQSAHEGPATPVSLSLTMGYSDELYAPDATEATSLRAIDFHNEAEKQARLKILPTTTLSSICAIRNKRNPSETYFVRLTWKPVPGQINKLQALSDAPITQDLKGRPISLSSSGEYYIMGFLGEEENIVAQGSNLSISYHPNGKALHDGEHYNAKAESGASFSRDIPLYFGWQPIILSGRGENLWLKTGSNEIDMMVLGMMLRASFTNRTHVNTMSYYKWTNPTEEQRRNDERYGNKTIQEFYPVRLKSFVFSSNVLSTSSRKFVLDNLPEIGVADTPLPVGEALHDERRYVFVDGGLDLLGDMSSAHNYFIWAMPKPAPENQTPLTHIIGDVSRLKDGVEQVYPKMKTLYLWGSTRQPQQRKSTHMRAWVVRPKQPLELIAPGYVSGTLGRFTSNKDKTRLYTYEEFTSPNLVLPSGYRIISDVPEAGSVSNINPGNGEDHILPSFESTGDVSYTKPVHFRVKGFPIDTYERWRQGETIYGMRYNGVQEGGSRQADLYNHSGSVIYRGYYSAWRYRYDAVRDGYTVECIQLGPYYKGNMDDICRESFWEFHKEDIIQRYYPNIYMKFQYYPYSDNQTWYRYNDKFPPTPGTSAFDKMVCSWIRENYQGVNPMNLGIGLRYSGRADGIKPPRLLVGGRSMHWIKGSEQIWIRRQLPIIPIQDENAPGYKDWPDNGESLISVQE